jgi:hypothetical protein
MAIELYGSRAFVRAVATAALGLLPGIAGCGGEQAGDGGGTRGEEDVDEAELALSGALLEGRRLFDEEQFGGNGRTCVMCHLRGTGTLNPAQVQEVYAADPQDPLFKHDGSDDFLGNGTTRILTDATILVRLTLPAGVELAGDAATRRINVRRAIPTTMNTPALDEVLMLDGRGSSLTGQANGAIRGHAQATILPTPDQLDLLVEFEKTGGRFFSSPFLQLYAEGGPAPVLPLGHSPAQQRGRRWFVASSDGFTLNAARPGDGLCAACHSGPLLNETTASVAAFGVPFPDDRRFQSILISELNEANNPVFDFVIANADGSKTPVGSSPDPGRAMITGSFVSTPFGLHAAFKIPCLWGVEKTAPYFHDNSAATLADAVERHATFFELAAGVVMTSQDKDDLVAYLKLL